jgi:hypothetical protein
LSFALAALAMQALLPAGLMVSPSAAHGAAITLCPQTHPLARAAAEKAAADSASTEDAAMAAMHAALGHASMGHAGMEHAAMGHAATDAGAVDHAAMGHMPASPDDETPASSAGSPAQSCAFAGAGALAGLLPETDTVLTAPRAEPPAPPQPMQPQRMAEPPRLRPPLRAPPALI